MSARCDIMASSKQSAIENLQLPDWPPIAVGFVILLIGMLLCVIGLCRVVVIGASWCWHKVKKEPRERG